MSYEAGNLGEARRTAGWYVLLLAWIGYTVLFFAFSKTFVKPAADITNTDLLDIAHRYASFAGAAIGLVAFLATGILYLAIRLARREPSRLIALLLTLFGYAPFIVFGWDLVYREPRYAEVARAIITYLGKPMLYSAAIVCGLAFLGTVLTLAIKKRY
jgi:hypothetical protein